MQKDAIRALKQKFNNTGYEKYAGCTQCLSLILPRTGFGMNLVMV